MSTHDLVKNIRTAFSPFGKPRTILAYWDFTSHTIPAVASRMRAELSASGVTVIDCPGEGRKAAAIKKMLGMSSHGRRLVFVDPHKF